MASLTPLARTWCSSSLVAQAQRLGLHGMRLTLAGRFATLRKEDLPPVLGFISDCVNTFVRFHWSSQATHLHIFADSHTLVCVKNMYISNVHLIFYPSWWEYAVTNRIKDAWLSNNALLKALPVPPTKAILNHWALKSLHWKRSWPVWSVVRSHFVPASLKESHMPVYFN